MFDYVVTCLHDSSSSHVLSHITVLYILRNNKKGRSPASKQRLVREPRDLSKYCDKYQIKLIIKIVFILRFFILFFDFRSVNKILCNFIFWVKSCKCLMYSPPSTPSSAPSLWHQQASVFEFHVGPYFFLNSNPKRTSLQNLTLLSPM